MEKVISMALVAVAISLSTVGFQAVSNNRILTPAVFRLRCALSNHTAFNHGDLRGGTCSHIEPVRQFCAQHGFDDCVFIEFCIDGYSTEPIPFSWSFWWGSLWAPCSQASMACFKSSSAQMCFNMLLNRLFANFNNVASELILISAVLVGGSSVAMYAKRYKLDVLSLGKSHSINLGLDYDKELVHILRLVFFNGVCVHGACGPHHIFGLFFQPTSPKDYLKHHEHKVLMIGTCLIAVTVLFVGQFLVEHVFEFGLPISVLVSMIGGCYFIYMLLKENRA